MSFSTQAFKGLDDDKTPPADKKNSIVIDIQMTPTVNTLKKSDKNKSEQKTSDLNIEKTGRNAIELLNETLSHSSEYNFMRFCLGLSFFALFFGGSVALPFAFTEPDENPTTDHHYNKIKHQWNNHTYHTRHFTDHISNPDAFVSGVALLGSLPLLLLTLFLIAKRDIYKKRNTLYSHATLSQVNRDNINRCASALGVLITPEDTVISLIKKFNTAIDPDKQRKWGLGVLGIFKTHNTLGKITMHQGPAEIILQYALNDDNNKISQAICTSPDEEFSPPSPRL